MEEWMSSSDDIVDRRGEGEGTLFFTLNITIDSVLGQYD